MTRLQRIVVAVFLAGIALVVPTVPASASDVGRAATPAVQVGPAAVQVQPLIAPTNTVWNYSHIGVGVIEKFNQPHAYGHYDAILPAEQPSYIANSADYKGWTTTGGFYIGPGYCADLYRHDFGLSGPWEFQGRIGPGEHPIGSNTSYRVYAFRPFSGSCA